MDYPNARVITVTATAAPADCTHPEQARTARTDHGSYDYVYEMCAACASDRPVHDDDDGCDICDDWEGPGHDWTPIQHPDDAPAEHLEAAGLTGAPGVQVDAYLEGRYNAWRAAETDAEAAGDTQDAKPPSAPSCPNCGGLVCAECAALYERTASHVYAGRCANGHAVPETAATAGEEN